MNVAELVGEVAGSVATVMAGASVIGQRRASSERQHTARVATRLLYGEVLFNVLALQAGAKVSPPRLVIQSHVYQGLLASGHFQLVGKDVDDLGTVAGAYATIAFTEAALDDDWMPLVATRLYGLDYQALEALAARFREAEQVLRGLAWNDDQRKVVEDELRNLGAERCSRIPQLAVGTTPVGLEAAAEARLPAIAALRLSTRERCSTETPAPAARKRKHP